MSAARRLGGRPGSVRIGSASGMCLAMARTTNGGQTWTTAPAPRATISTAYGTSPVSVRFADPMDGWIDAVNPTRLWSTHDGGIVWQPVTAPGCRPPAADLGHGSLRRLRLGGRADSECHHRAPGALSRRRRRLDRHQHRGADRRRTGPGHAARPARTRAAGCSRTTGPSSAAPASTAPVSGSRGPRPARPPTGPPPWPPPRPPTWWRCAPKGPGGRLATCRPAPPSPSTWMFTSSDGGTSFQAVGAVPAGPTPAASNPAGVASPAPATVVVAASQPAGGVGGADVGVLSASFDGGHTLADGPAGAIGRPVERPRVHHAHPGRGGRRHPVRVDLLHDQGRRAHLDARPVEPTGPLRPAAGP